MDDAAPHSFAEPPPHPLAALDDAVARAAEALLTRQKPDGHWLFELEADATIPAEYILLKHYLGEAPDLELERKIGVYLRRVRGAHGGWPLYHSGALDVSATVKAYFALKMIGDYPGAPHMAAARAALLAAGGAGACNVFTRILLALFGVMSWRAVPEMPAQIILLPRWFPIHLSKISYWARTVIVPLLVLRALKPRARNHRRVVRPTPAHHPLAGQGRASEGAMGERLLRPGRGAEGGRTAVSQILAPPRHRKGGGLRR